MADELLPTPDDDLDPSSALYALIARGQTTTEEAKQRSNQILDRFYDSDSLNKQEELVNDLRQNAERSKQILRGAKEKLLAKPAYDEKLKWLRFAAAMAQPTRTGGFAESMGFGAESLANSRAEQMKAEDNQLKQLMALQQGVEQIDRGQLEAELSAQQSTRKDEAQLAKEALRTLSRSVRGSRSGGPKPGDNPVVPDAASVLGPEKKESTIWELTGLGTGPTSSFRAALSNLTGLLNLPVADETIQARQSLQVRARDLARSLIDNPRMPVRLVEMALEDASIAPEFWKTPKVAREKQVALDRELFSRYKEAVADVNNPTLDKKIRNAQAQNARALQTFLEDLGVPEELRKRRGVGSPQSNDDEEIDLSYDPEFEKRIEELLKKYGQ